MGEFKSILITGGAGYIGSVLTKKLVDKGHKVTILDSLIFGRGGVSDLIDKNHVKLITEDIRNKQAVRKALSGIDCVIHLASIVGEPLCNKIPMAARQINELATPHLVNMSKEKGVSRFIYASTCSNYGSSSDLVDESSPVNSLSLYSESKVRSESIVLGSKDVDFEPCVLRFATAFGLSPRMRFDLLLQEFIRDAFVNKKIVVFGPDYWRPLVHVVDISQSCVLAIENPSSKISGEIYNVGSNDQNYKKIDLAEMVAERIHGTEVVIQESRKDPRNYRVSFDKIRARLNFHIEKTVSDGITEIAAEIEKGRLDPRETEFSNMSKLTEKVQSY